MITILKYNQLGDNHHLCTVRPLSLSLLETNRSMMTYTLSFNKTNSNPLVSWYINPRGKHILVSTGISAEEHKKTADILMNDVRSLEAALQSSVLKPENILMNSVGGRGGENCLSGEGPTSMEVKISHSQLMLLNTGGLENEQYAIFR